jgi:ABC-type transport system involved in multi-copper enzyme maturation permease subunit
LGSFAPEDENNKVKYPNLYWRAVLTVALIIMSLSLFSSIYNIIKSFQVVGSLKVSSHILSYTDSGFYFHSFVFSIIGIVISVGLLICSSSIKEEKVSKFNFIDFIMRCIFYSIIPLLASIIVLIIASTLTTYNQNQKIESWIDKELGATYQTAEDSNLTPYQNDYYSNSIYLDGQGKNFYLKKGVQDGNKVTLMFVEIEEELEFVKDGGSIHVKR